jgi:glycosyltransferase involved in cell wall biosynthesis
VTSLADRRKPQKLTGAEGDGRRLPTFLLVTNYPETAEGATGGRELLCALNHSALRQIYGDRFRLFYLQPKRESTLLRRLAALRGHVNGVDTKTLHLLVHQIRQHCVAKVFIDGSNLGHCARFVKKHCPEVEVATFFHNVEARFFAGALRSSRSLKALGVLAANFVAERQAVRYSDKRICLSDRDGQLLASLYGRAATHVSPMAVRDQLPDAQRSLPAATSGKFALFVGGLFYANLQGIRWFVENVLPRVDIELCIVGRGFEKFRDELERTERVRVVGGVDNLAEWYSRCAFVVAPIFDGSGMKTKVAEALMFGKRIVGTPEAFSGYEDVAGTAGWVCRTPDDFVHAIARARATSVPAFDPELRSVYERNYSLEAATQRLAADVGPLFDQGNTCAA